MFRPYSFWRAQLTVDRLVALFVTLAPLLYFLPAVCGQLVISPDDGVIQNIPLRAAAADLVRAGYLPLWNPSIFSGMPLHAAAQAGVLFPLNWFYLVCSIPRATNLMMLSTYMVAALGAYLYARRSGSSVAGAALTSLVWQWSGFLVGQIGHTNIVQTAALFPWLFWAIDGYAASSKRSRGVLIALIVALTLWAGHQQTFVHLYLVAAAYAMVMAWSAKDSRSSYLRSLVFLAAGLALAAVQILPTLELLRHSLRAEATYEFFTSFSMPRRFLLTLFAPYLMGGGDGGLFRAPYVGPSYYVEYNCYVGLATIALALVAFGLKRDARTTFWVGVAMAGLLLALGRYAPFGFYQLVYHVPVLNLFRVPARHLMEVQFALAVLAGRGLTILADARGEIRTLRWLGAIAVGIVAMAWLSVTIGRPVDFKLGREAPVTLLRAPELFLPIVFALATALALWAYARRRQGATIFLFAILSLDLGLWGQSSGWRVASPKSDFELWRTPPTVQFLRTREAGKKPNEPYRIFTQDRFFDPKAPGVSGAPGGAWVPTLQPDIYMMFGLQNAAGYEGFGLARYSRLAGDMKVWGELTEPERTLGSDSRELDLLNVRYLLARSSPAAPGAAGQQDSQYPMARHTFGGQRFGDEDVTKSALGTGERVFFKVPPVEAERIALLTTLAWSEPVPNQQPVGEVRLTYTNGQTYDFVLRAGEHTAEWAYDRPDIQRRMKHQRAPIGVSYEVKDAQGNYQANIYVSSFVLPNKATIKSVEITVTPVETAPQMTLQIGRLTLVNGGKAFPLRSSWAERTSSTEANEKVDEPVSRWKRIAELGDVAVFENAHALPRAWLAANEMVATSETQLEIIRSGKAPDGRPWNPLETALIESSAGLTFEKGSDAAASAAIKLFTPNRIKVETQSASPAILVLSENHYPGWLARIDGRSVPILRVNYNQRGIAVPGGNHMVTFIYRPRSILVGLGISLFTLAILLLWTSRVPDRLFGRRA